MNLLMFTGESMLLGLYYAGLRETNEINPIYFAAPASLDFFGSFLNFIGIIYLNASSYQILKTLSMVFCIILSRLFLRKTYSKSQYFSLIIVVLGLAIISFYTSNTTNSNLDSSSNAIGVMCMIIGQAFHGS